MLAAAVGAFHQQEIDVRNGHRIAQHFVGPAADVTGEEEALPLAVRLVVHFQQNLRAAEDVSGVDESDRHTVRHQHWPVVADRHKLAQATLRILLGVGERGGLQPLLFPMFVQPLDVALLDPRAVGQHDLAEVPCRMGGVDVAGEALDREVRQIAAVVDVRVGKNDQVDGCRIKKRKTAVHLVRVLARSLIEPAVEKDAPAVDLQQMLRTGGGAGGTAEFEFHGFRGRVRWMGDIYHGLTG